jgi:hypothetical protein
MIMQFFQKFESGNYELQEQCSVELSLYVM